MNNDAALRKRAERVIPGGMYGHMSVYRKMPAGYPQYYRRAGGMNGVMFDHGRGLIHGAACWRADGTPVGISGGPAKPGIIGATYVL